MLQTTMITLLRSSSFRAGWISILLLTPACPGPPRPPEPPPTEVLYSAPEPPPCAPTSAPSQPAPGTRIEGNLVLQNTPPVPEALRARFKQYLGMRGAAIQRLADDGKSMLIATRFAQTSQVHLVRRPLGARRQLTFEREPIHEASFVPGPDSGVVYVSDIGGNEQYQLFRYDLGTGRSHLLTDGKSRHGPYVWSHDGKQIAYTSNARNGRDMDLYLGDGRSAAAGRLLLERAGHWGPLDWSRDDKKLLIMHYVSINDSRLYVVDVATKQVTRVTPEQPRASYRAAVFDHTGKRIYAATDRDGEFVELHRIDLATGTWKPMTREIEWNVTDLALSPDGRTLAFVTNEDGYGVLYFMDTRTGRYRKVPKIPSGLIFDLHFARKAPVLGLTLMGHTRTADAYTYDLRRRRLVRWTESELGGLNPKRFVEPTLIHYPTFDARKIPAFYFRPGGPGPHPVVIWIHGGPESQAQAYFRPLTQYLVVEGGMALLIPNVRGSDGYGKSYLLLDNGAKREDSVKDIGALLDWIAARKELDAARVGVFGGSYGGYMVLASLVHYAARIRAGVDIVGISNFVTFLKNTKAYRRDLRRAEYGDERDKKMHDFLEKISPSNNAHKIRSALFVAHGANDPRVPLSETDQIVAAVRQQGQEVWYMVAKDEGHGFRKRRNRDIFYYLTAIFLEKHLKAASSSHQGK